MLCVLFLYHLTDGQNRIDLFPPSHHPYWPSLLLTCPLQVRNERAVWWCPHPVDTTPLLHASLLLSGQWTLPCQEMTVSVKNNLFPLAWKYYDACLVSGNFRQRCTIGSTYSQVICLSPVLVESTLYMMLFYSLF